MQAVGFYFSLPQAALDARDKAETQTTMHKPAQLYPAVIRCGRDWKGRWKKQQLESKRVSDVLISVGRDIV